MLAGGVLIAAVLWAVMGGATHWMLFVPAQIAIGFGYYMMHTVLQSRATELMPEARSTSVAAFVFMLFLGQALGALAFGAAIAAWGYRAAFARRRGVYDRARRLAVEPPYPPPRRHAGGLNRQPFQPGSPCSPCSCASARRASTTKPGKSSRAAFQITAGLMRS